VIETERLILRPWRDADREPFAAMSVDPDVMETLGGVLTRQGADAYIDKHQAHIERLGFGRWAVELRSGGEFIGAVGLAPIWPGLPLPTGYEMGWRLARHAWGFGYATEAAAAAIQDGFQRGGLAEIYAFTSAPNLRSQAVMARLGLGRAPELDFLHPDLPEDDPTRPYLVWRGVSAAWSDRS
jgi:RimJ/RimL family protein N-acetyltransferase